ncbi:MAG: leucyl/phenylalanyl-tRNA--protein transferase [Spirochaetales bacterium]|nr:leucyl/phenylalanyl-tRNA--protein transferase [Spirochaetales bacterium]
MLPELDQNQRIQFPDPLETDDEGLVAIGGNLSPGVLLSAYEQGIFPWFDQSNPVLWWSPNPRCILRPQDRHISASMKKVLARGEYTLSFDTVFRQIISFCAGVKRKEQQGTWITGEMEQAYYRMHELGFAHSVEVWKDGILAGGLYGLSLGNMFFGESMFSLRKNASKFALLKLAEFLERQSFLLIDCQLYTDHLASLGAVKMERNEFLRLLRTNIGQEGLYGSWCRFNSGLN